MDDKKKLKEEELEKVSGGTTLSDMPQRNVAPSGGGIYAEKEPEPVDCSGLIPS